MLAGIRKPIKIVTPQFVMEGAGVKLRRSFPTKALDYPDPFLLFDHFGSDNPQDYLKGFPMHPHRGIETVTYMLAGTVHHRDSLGNGGMIEAGDVQWMTAGRGILHEEMPKPRNERMEGFQLWVNLPAYLKMSQPKYQGILANQIPSVKKDGIEIKVICGDVDSVHGPVIGIAAEPLYLDVHLPAETRYTIPIAEDHSVLIYIYDGDAIIGNGDEIVTSPKMVIMGAGDHLTISTNGSEARFLLMAGRPMNEPIVRYGPFVMNTWDEIEDTLRDLRNGTFISR